MRYEISVNIDVEDGISNGVSGVLMGVTKIPKIIDDEIIGKNCRINWKYFTTQR